MKKTLMLITSLLFVGALAHAADAEKTESTTVDTSKNPVTGTTTTKKKMKKKSHDSKGEHKSEMTETVKEKSDGTKTKSVEATQESTEKTDKK